MTPKPICPHCLHEEQDAFEINFGDALDGDAEVTCGSCGEDYFCTRIVHVDYKTAKLKENNFQKGETD